MKSECDTFMRQIFNLLLKYSTLISDRIKKRNRKATQFMLCCSSEYI